MKTTFRARIHDPVGPRWTRFLLPSLALVTAFLDYVWSALDDATPGPAFFVAALLLLWSRPLLGRHRSKNCAVVVEPGRVAIAGAGLLNQVIHTTDVIGASTSSSPDEGTSVAVARNGRSERPLHIEVEKAAHANKIREALGIGFGGYGTLRWRARRAHFGVFALLGRLVGTAAALSMAVDALRETRSGAGSWLILVLSFAIVFLGPLLAAAKSAADGLLWFNDFGIFHGDSKRTHHIAYDEVTAVAAHKRTLRITRTNGSVEAIPIRRARHSLNGLSQLEVDHIVAQIKDAIRRAHGEVQQDEAAPAGIEMLARSSADEPRAWLDRLDATAGNMGGGYRSVNLTKEALVSALQDPDAAPDVRVGAVRVLSRIAKDEARTRVAEITEAVRDQSLRQRMRIVLDDDPDEAASELALLDARENKLKL